MTLTGREMVDMATCEMHMNVLSLETTSFLSGNGREGPNRALDGKDPASLDTNLDFGGRYVFDAHLPRPGDALAQDSPFAIRFKNDTRREQFDFTSQAPSGYRVVSTELHVTDRKGDTSGPFVEMIAGDGSSLFSESLLDERYRDVADLIARLDGEAKAQGRDAKGLVDLKIRLDQERDRMVMTRNQYASSHSAVRVRGSAACVWTANVFGAHWYTSGASLQGFVRSNMVYIGNNDYLAFHLEQIKKEALAAASH